MDLKAAAALTCEAQGLFECARPPRANPWERSTSAATAVQLSPLGLAPIRHRQQAQAFLRPAASGRDVSAVHQERRPLLQAQIPSKHRH